MYIGIPIVLCRTTPWLEYSAVPNYGNQVPTIFSSQFRSYLWLGNHFVWCRKPLVRPDNFTWGHSMKIEWLAANVTTVRSPDRAQDAIFGVCNSCRIPWQSGTCYFGGDFGLASFRPIQVVFVIQEPPCDVGTSSWDLMTLPWDI